MESEPYPAAFSPTSVLAAAAPAVRYLSGFWRRLFAFAIDVLLVGLAVLIPGLIGLSFFSKHENLSLLFGFSIAFAYFSVLNSEIGGGQTLAKRWLHIRVSDEFGRPISYPRSALRSFALLTPFFLEDADVPCGGTHCALPAFVNTLCSIWKFSLAYLYIFNPSTRQSLDDVCVNSFVIDASLWRVHAVSPAIAGPAGAVPENLHRRVTDRHVWAGHYAILSVFLVVFLVASFAMPTFLAKSGTLANLWKLQSEIATSGRARSVTIQMGENWTNGQTSHYLNVNFVPTHEEDDDKAATEIASIVLNRCPSVYNRDVLIITVLHQTNFGFAHFNSNRRFSHTPAEWKAIVSRASGTTGSATVKFLYSKPPIE